MMELLKKNIGGLPVGVWLLILAAGVGAGIVLHKRGTQQAADAAAQDTSSQDASGNTVPYDALPQESSGYFPAAGPPIVGGGTTAIRLQPGVLRIRVVQSRHHKRKGSRAA